jgi:hypothetical protein
LRVTALETNGTEKTQCAGVARGFAQDLGARRGGAPEISGLE